MRKTISILTALILAVSLTACGNDTQTNTEAQPTSEATDSNTYYGTLKSVSETKVIPKGKGQIIKSPFNVGDAVNEGDLLYEIDDNGLADNIATTKNSIAKADISIKTARENQSNLKVYAPASGILKSFTIKTGERVNSTKIGEIKDETVIIAKVPFNENQKNSISIGDSATVISAEYMSSVTGTVTRISDEKNSSFGGSILYNVEITINNPGNLTEGKSVNAKITNAGGTYSSPESGITVVKDTASVVSKGSGNATNVYYKEGDYVKKGAVIVEMENSTVSSALDRAVLDKKDLSIRLASYEKDYADLFVYAPAGGKITSMSKHELDNITSNSESVMTIADVSRLTLKLNVSENIIKKLNEGDPVDIRVNDESKTILVGTIEKLEKDGVISGSSKTYPVTISADNSIGVEAGTAAGVDFGGETK